MSEINLKNKPTFKFGKLVITRGVNERIDTEDFYNFVCASFARYLLCDWGDLDEEDKALNDEAVKTGEDRIFAAYKFQDSDEQIYIITEADRSVTTILFPYEY